MNWLVWKTLEDVSTNGSSNDLVSILTIPSLDIPIFYPLILFAIFIILTTTIFFRQVDREGRGEFLASISVASFSTSLIALSMRLLGIIGAKTLTWTVSVSVVLIAIYLCL